MSFLITQSLIGSWNYMMNCREEYQETAYNDFLNTLNRIPKETTPEMQNGIDFENLVYALAKGAKTCGYMPATDPSIWEPQDGLVPFDVKDHKWYRGARAVATIIKGASVQVKAQRELTLGSMSFLVYGILDALKAGVIYDVKFSNKGFGSADLAGKYLDSPQHPTYFYLIPEAREFNYLVSDGVDVYTETYTPSITRPFKEIVEDFITSLEAMHLLDTYKEKWAAL